MIIEAAFVTSAAGAADFPRGDLPEIAMVGRSNVGKSSLINALARQRIARTSAAPGKTRLANIYRVARGAGDPFYLVDLPGYGYARGGKASALEFEQLTFAYFGSRHPRSAEASRSVRPTDGGDADGARGDGVPTARTVRSGVSFSRAISALLLVDARHPGLASDRAAWQWLQAMVERVAVVATKIDKLARGERIRAQRDLESMFEDSVLPVSAATGEGLDELWKLIERLRHSSSPRPGSPAAPGKPPRRHRKN